MRVVWEVERTDWFGECEVVKQFATRAEAVAFRKLLQKESDAVDEPDDEVRYRVVRTELKEVARG